MHTPSFVGRLRPLALLVVATLAAATPRARAQAPPPPPPHQDEKLQNLQVLPKNSDRAFVLGQMRRFADALGVGCDHCHVEVSTGEGDKAGRPEMNFGSDKKETKNVARVMMRMVQEINQRELPKIGRTEFRKVSCFTCHHGLEEPDTLADALDQAMKKGGAEAGVARYKELRARYFGSGAYDFSADAVAEVAGARAREGKDADGALALLRAGLEFTPNEAELHAAMGDILARKGDREAALVEMQKAVELRPDDRRLRFRLERLKQPPGEGGRPRP